MENLHIFLEFASMQILTRSTLLTALTRVSFWLIAKKLTTITNSLPENLLKANSNKGSFWLIAKKLTTATMASCKKHSKKLEQHIVAFSPVLISYFF